MQEVLTGCPPPPPRLQTGKARREGTLEDHSGAAKRDPMLMPQLPSVLGCCPDLLHTSLDIVLRLLLAVMMGQGSVIQEPRGQSEGKRRKEPSCPSASPLPCLSPREYEAAQEAAPPRRGRSTSTSAEARPETQAVGCGAGGLSCEVTWWLCIPEPAPPRSCANPSQLMTKADPQLWARGRDGTQLASGFPPVWGLFGVCFSHNHTACNHGCSDH